MPERNVGLARALSKLGYCSRSKAAELIRAGRVRINGAVRKNAEAPVHLGKDRLEVDGLRVSAAEKLYLMLNKPRGVVTTASDEQGRDSVYKYLSAFLGEDSVGDGGRKSQNWVAPIGRLDKASEGLLLLTNDSEWGAKIVSPETHVDKTYHVQIDAQPDGLLVGKLIEGFKVNDGEFLRVKAAGVLRTGERNGWLEIILDEGRNRHIRRMFEALDIEVLRLIRVAIGGLQLGELAKGKVRALTTGERALLFTKSKAK
jgi:23S rRNA pseudouridine2605 synthase